MDLGYGSRKGMDVVGTDRAMLAICWDDWDGGVGEDVARITNRHC